MVAAANRVGLAFVEETVWGTTPSGPPKLKDLRFTGESLKKNVATAESAEIRTDRQTTDLIRTSIGADGEINGEISYGAYDDFFEGALMGADWSSASAVASADTDVSASSVDNSFNRVADWDTNPSVGQWLKSSGFANAANNGIFKVVSVTSKKIVVSGGTLTTEAATPAVTISRGAEIKNGTTVRSYSIEKAFNDIATAFAAYTGMTIQQFGVDVKVGGISTCKFSFLGKDETTKAATIGDSANTAAPTNDVMNSIDHVYAVLENQASMDIMALAMTGQNNFRALEKVGALGAFAMGVGSLKISGTLQAYMANQTLIEKFRAGTATTLALVLRDASLNIYVLDFPRVKFSTGQTIAGGKDQDMIVDLGWSAIMHATELVTMRMVRFPVA